MDPEDVLDFGEDDDGLDVISLGGSDHDGRPVSHRSSSTLPDHASRETPHLRPSPPSRSRHLKSPRPQYSSSDRSSRRQSTQNPSHAPHPSRRNHHLSNSDRPHSHHDRRESSSRELNRPAVVEASRPRLPSDRPKPGERASYMPPDRLQALSHSSRNSDPFHPRNHARHSVPSLSARITDHRHVPPKVEPRVSLPKLMPESDQPEEKIEAQKLVTSKETMEVEKPVSDETKEAQKPVPEEKKDDKKSVSEQTKETKKPVSGENKELKKPDHSSLDPSGEKLPEGWISRISKAGKTYYVNVFTRTSQWARPTEPAIDKQLKPTGKVASKPSAVKPVPAETVEKSTDQTTANIQKPDAIDAAESSSVVSRSQKQVPDRQFASRPLGDSSEELRPSSKKTSHDDPKPIKPLEPVRHPEASQSSAEHENGRSSLPGPGSAQDFGHNNGTRSMPQETPQSAVSESYPRGPRIHPDRRQEIVAASVNPPYPPSVDRPIRQEPRRWEEFPRYPQEPEAFRHRSDPRPRSISPNIRYIPSHGPMERHHREPVQLSGANGIPKAPGRSFPEHRPSLRSSQDFDAPPESSRYNKNAYIPYMPAKEHNGQRNADWWRGPPDDAQNRRMVSPQDRVPTQWPSRPVSPVYSSHRHRLSSRPRSPSPSPRRVSSYQDLQRVPYQPDLHRSERPHPPPVSNRAIQEDWPSKSPQSSDLMRRSKTSRFDTYRPSPSGPMVTNGLRFQDSRRGDTCPSRDQGPRHIDHSEVEPLRTQATKPPPFSTDLPKTSSALAQPDFYRPPPLSMVASKQSPRRAPPSKDDSIIDLDGVMSKDEPPLRPFTEKNSNNLPSESVSQGHPSAETSHSSALHRVDRAPNKPRKNDVEPLANVASKPSTLTAPVADDRATRVSSRETKDVTEDGFKATSDIIVLSSPPSPVSQQKTVPLAKRLGPVANYSSESDNLTPPTKKHRRNPVEKCEAVDRSNVPPDNVKSSSLEEERNSSKNTEPNSKDTLEDIKSQQPESAKQTNRLDELPPSPSQGPQDKVISLRGRAARQSADAGVDKQSWSKVEEKGPSESTPTVGGSLRDRIQDLNIPSARSIRSRPFSHTDSNHHTLQRSGHHQARPSVEDSLPPSRHISERISGIRAPMSHSPSSNGNYRSPRYVPRQSDSGWSGRRAKYP